MAEAIRMFELDLRAVPAPGDELASARRRHLAVKAELARAWMFAVAPYEAVRRALPGENSVVPVEYFLANVLK